MSEPSGLEPVFSIICLGEANRRVSFTGRLGLLVLVEADEVEGRERSRMPSSMVSGFSDAIGLRLWRRRGAALRLLDILKNKKLT